MPGAHSYPAAHRGRWRRLGVLVLLTALVAAASVRSGADRTEGDRQAADHVASAGSTATASEPAGESSPEPSGAPSGRAAPDVDAERLAQIRREWFLLPAAAPVGAGPPAGSTVPATAATPSTPTGGSGVTGLSRSAPPPPQPPADPRPSDRGDGGEAEGHQVPPAFDDLRPELPERAVTAYRSAEIVLRRALPGCHLDRHLLAAIGTVESDNGRFGGATAGADGRVSPPILGIVLDGSRPGTAIVRDTDGGRLDGHTGYDRAVGPMQFLPGTWTAFGRSAQPGRTPDPQNIDDAALSAGWYLCAGGRDLSDPSGRRAAVLAYNPSNAYADTVIALSRALAGDPTPVTTSAPTTPSAPTTSAPTTSAPTTRPVVGTPPRPTPTTPTPTTTTRTTTTTTTTTRTTTTTTTPTTTTPTTTTPTTTTPTTTTTPATSTTSTSTSTSTSQATPNGLVLAEDPAHPGQLRVTWEPADIDVTVRLERQDDDGDWQSAGDPDHVHVPSGAKPSAVWDGLPSGRYRATLLPPADADGEPRTSEELELVGAQQSPGEDGPEPRPSDAR